ncbi:unnamed protein product, partial [marine sediment metagenome]
MAEYLKRALAQRQPNDPQARQGLIRALAASQGMGGVMSTLSGGEVGKDLQRGADPLAYAMSEQAGDRKLARENAGMERQAQRDVAEDAWRAGRLRNDALRARNTRSGTPMRITKGEREQLLADKQMLGNARQLVGSFKPEYAQGAFPGARTASNFLAGSLGMGTDEMKEAQGWWSDWDLLYTLPERNEKFGATLTPSEAKAWRLANIQGEQDPQQIRRKQQVMIDIMESKMASNAEFYADTNLSDNQYNSIFGDTQPSTSGGTGKYE